MSKIIKRILSDNSGDNIFSTLSKNLNPSDLQSLLIEVYKSRAEALNSQSLMKTWSNNRFVCPSPADPRLINKFDGIAFSLLPEDVKIIELSPVAPLGTCSSLAPVDQKKIVATIRNTEIVADPTNVLAMECARHRLDSIKKNPKSDFKVKFCTSHRVIRSQPFYGPASFSHFRLLALCTAGRDTGCFDFECETLYEHIAYYIGLLYSIPGILDKIVKMQVNVTVFDESDKTELLYDRVIEPLESEFKKVDFKIDSKRKGGRNYYDNICFSLNVIDSSGQKINLVDGGLTDWTRQLMNNNKKERFFSSAIGSERVCHCFME